MAGLQGPPQIRMKKKAVFKHDRPLVKRWHFVLTVKLWKWVLPFAVPLYALLNELFAFNEHAHITIKNMFLFFVASLVPFLKDVWKICRPRKIVIEGCSRLAEIMKEIVPPDGYRILQGGHYICSFTPDNASKNRDRFDGYSAVSDGLTKALWKVRFDLHDGDHHAFGTGPGISVTRTGRSFGRYRPWRLPPVVEEMLLMPLVLIAQKSNHHLTNGSKVRLCYDPVIRPDGAVSITVEKTDYLSDLATAQISGSVITDIQGRVIYNGRDYFVGSGNRLRTCEKSACSNQLGGSVLLMLLDQGTDQRATSGKIVITGQGTGNLQSPGLLAPSGSGSFDWDDFVGSGRGNVHPVAYGMLRELLQETCRIDIATLRTVDLGIRFFLTGYGRMLHRGGKPEFYGVACMNMNYLERIGAWKSEKPFVSSHHMMEMKSMDPRSVLDALEKFSSENAATLSHPLWMGIELFKTYLEAQENLTTFNGIITGSCAPPAQSQLTRTSWPKKHS